MKKQAFIFIVLASVLWGTSGLFVNVLAPFGFSSLHMSAMRGGISFLCLLVFVLIKDRSLMKIKLGDLFIVLLSGVSMFGAASSYYAAMQASSVSTAVVLMYTAPIYVLIYSVLFLSEKLTPVKMVSIVLMLIGCCLVSGIIGGLKFSIAGILLGFLSGISYGAYNIFTKIAMRRKINPVTVTFYNFAVMFILATCVSNPAQLLSITSANPAETIPLIVGIGIFTGITPYFLYTLSLKEIPAGTASALGIIEPMAATIFSVLILKETLTLQPLMGIVLILGSVFLLSTVKE